MPLAQPSPIHGEPLDKHNLKKRPEGRKHRSRGERPVMARPTASLDEQDLERALLRKSVGTLEEERHVCADCGRTPLIGETVYGYARATSVCELCRQLRRDEPERSVLVRHTQAGLAVRVHRMAKP